MNEWRMVRRHVRGRVLAALANGQVALFCRRPADAEWDVAWHWLLELAPPTVAVRCLTRVHGTVWASFRNKIAVIDPNAMRVEVRSRFPLSFIFVQEPLSLFLLAACFLLIGFVIVVPFRVSFRVSYQITYVVFFIFPSILFYFLT